jgi:hypothetical protein
MWIVLVYTVTGNGSAATTTDFVQFQFGSQSTQGGASGPSGKKN